LKINLFAKETITYYIPVHPSSGRAATTGAVSFAFAV